MVLYAAHSIMKLLTLTAAALAFASVAQAFVPPFFHDEQTVLKDHGKKKPGNKLHESFVDICEPSRQLTSDVSLGPAVWGGHIPPGPG